MKITRQDLIGDDEEWRSNGTNRKIVVVTSQQINIPLHDLKAAGSTRWPMPSWTWDEYRTACENEDFYQQVKRFLPEEGTKQEKLDVKYYLAGGSARWMFGLSFAELPKEINDQIVKVQNKNDLLAGLNGNTWAGAVGHLTMVNSRGKEVLVSLYVMSKVAETVDVESNFLMKVRQYARQYNNPAFEGWVVEFDFLFRVRQAEAEDEYLGLIVHQHPGGEQEMWPVVSITCEVDPTNRQQMQNLTIKEGSWFFPKLWN